MEWQRKLPTVTQPAGFGGQIEAASPLPGRPVLTTVQLHHCRKLLYQYRAARSTYTPWAVPGAQIEGAHPIASSNLNMLTPGVGSNLGCRHRKK